MVQSVGLKWLWVILTLLSLVIVACGETPATATPDTATATPAGLTPLITASGDDDAVLAPLPTLFPTATGLVQAEATATRAAAAPGPTHTPINFQQVVVSLTYSIPGLQLRRTLEGTISSQINIFDETSGARLTKQNQAAVLLDVQQVLENIELEPYPEDCPGCVLLEFELPLSDVSGAGWLQNETILASLENYFAANLGPHFPPETVIGLRRSASSFAPAHTLAVAEGGQLWFWSAIEATITVPEVDDDSGLTLIDAGAPIDIEQLATSYRADCPGNARETLFLGVTAPILIAIQCPELALPTTLTSFYGELAATVAASLGDVVLAPPDRLLPLDAYLYYERPDATLVLYPDGRAVVEPVGFTVNSSQPPSQTVQLTGTFTATAAISLTQSLRELDMLRGPLTQEITARNLVTDTATLDPYMLILRDDVAVWAATWQIPPSALALYTAQLDSLIGKTLQILVPTPTPLPEGMPTVTLTPAGTAPATPATTPTPTPDT